tara:strand:- start:37973 stop:38278 length:306 start_codon:yes stop_codon:yes gene_type:complete
MSFQKTVLIIAAIVLSVMLFFIGLAMQGLKKAQQYPPEVSVCPDYWSKDSNGACVANPLLKLNTGSDDPTPNCQKYDETKGIDKKIWADSCGVKWDGITNI